MQTNSIDGSQYIAASMFNHSCDNNIAWSPSDPTKTLLATRPIVAGEEIYYNYGPKEDLKEYFGFDCQCPACRPKSDNCDAVDKCDKRSAEDVWFPRGIGAAATQPMRRPRLKNRKIALKKKKK